MKADYKNSLLEEKLVQCQDENTRKETQLAEMI